MGKPWARLEQNYINHPKFLALNAAAIGLWLEGKNYCDMHLTDGLIPRSALRTFRFMSQHNMESLCLSAGAKASGDAYAPLWERITSVGFKMHDYLDHNDCRDEILDRMAAADDARDQEDFLRRIGRDRGLIDQIRARDGNRCRYCGHSVYWRDRRGANGGTYVLADPNGPDVLDNIVVACRGCASRRDDLPRPSPIHDKSDQKSIKSRSKVGSKLDQSSTENRSEIDQEVSIGHGEQHAKASQTFEKPHPGTDRDLPRSSPNLAQTGQVSSLSTETETVLEVKKEREKSPASLSPPAVSMNGTTDEQLANRAGAFCERYAELYREHREGAFYYAKPALDFPVAVNLCRTWPDDRLARLAVVFLTSNHRFAEEGSRTIGQFAALASWCDSKLIEWERSHANT